jgi:NAD(P)H-dependent FMN reductase/dienelactone hydrolase
LADDSPYTRKPLLIVHREDQARKDTYGAIEDAVVLQGQLMRGDEKSNTVLVVMHPVGAPAYLPIFSRLAQSGHHILACGSRYWNGDAALQMENVLVDLAACVRHARERLGYERVVLLGWSGGGSIMAGFQAEAERRTILQSASGEPTTLSSTALLPGDALLLIASHRSRHHLLTGQLDASIRDEQHPEQQDPALNLYDPENPNQPPYDSSFLAHYRAAQVARNRHITEWVRGRLAALKHVGRAHDEECFVVQGTMADPRWLDPAIEPNDRKAGWTYLGDPRIVNNSPVALGRYSSLRSWLSQWSLDAAQVDSVVAGPRISVPSLVVTASADDACPVSHTQEMFEALASKDKQSHRIEGANHYFSGPKGREHLEMAARVIGGWLRERGLAGAERPKGSAGKPRAVVKPLIVGIGGTLRDDSSGASALRFCLRHAAEKGADATLFTGADLQMPLYDPQTRVSCEESRRLIDTLRRADGIILASPGYHGSISGVIKNALDYTEEMAADERVYFDGRAVGCIASAAGWQGATATLAALRSIVHALRGWPTPLGVTMNSSDRLFDDAGACLSEALRSNLVQLTEQVLDFAGKRVTAVAVSRVA